MSRGPGALGLAVGLLPGRAGAGPVQTERGGQGHLRQTRWPQDAPKMATCGGKAWCYIFWATST